MPPDLTVNGPFPTAALAPEDKPHGLLTPPLWVYEWVVCVSGTWSPEVFAPEAEERLLCEETLQLHFEAEGYEVLYRRTPHGPEVVAVGFVEIHAIRQGLSEAEQAELSTFVPWRPVIVFQPGYEDPPAPSEKFY